ncbi:interleukin-20 receptor subunit alpha [Dunckerocampus dactyliophorus]|uniref:interleukin-20 receptor subunit alpha n=1 Tax=Dunckerocampus dactyliophorus TaxID=161453 RepID=UPI0024064207|nr:interleukin-20 receptor subunit alpha [Dunckerocampus dactyliophorus]
MRTVLLLLNLGALCFSTGTSPPPSPVNISFSSVNLRNILQWLPGNTTPDGTRFTVQYAFYGDSVEGSKGRRVNWRPVQKCKEIAETWCDLTRETWDVQQSYHGRVRSAVGSKAFSKWALTQGRFNPKYDTTFGQPLLSVEVKDNNNAIVHLKGPIRYQPDDHAPPISMATLYPYMTYNLSVHNGRRGQVHHFPVTSSPYTYHLMDYDTEYCFSAKARFLSLPFQCRQSELHCLTTTKDPVKGQLQRVVVGIVVPSMCICILMVVGYFLYHFLTGKEHKRPSFLDVPLLPSPPLTFPPERLNPILVTTVRNDLSSDTNVSHRGRPEKWRQQANLAFPPSRYAAQQPEMPSELPLDLPPELEEPLDNVSSYGVVGVAPRNDSDDHPDTVVSQCYFPQESTQTQLERSTQAQVPSPMPDMEIVEERDFSRSSLNNYPTTGLRIPSEERMEQDIRTYRTLGKDVQRVHLLSTSHAAPSTPSNDSPDDYGELMVRGLEEDKQDKSLHINWDPWLRNLVLPGMEVNQEGGSKEEEVANKELGLDNVLLKQASRGEAGPQPGPNAGWEVDDIVSKWKLVISMEE